MRSKILLTTTAVAAIFAAASLASGEGVSQGTNEPHKGAQSSDSQQQRQGKGASSTGQQDKGTAQRQDKGTSGQQGAQGDQGKGASSTGQQGTTSQTSGVNQRNQTQRQSPSTKDEGQPGAQPGIDLSAEQRTRIRDIVLNTSNAPRVASPKFSVSVGTVVPPSVRFVRLPAPIAEIYPAWRDYDYIVVGDQILIIVQSTIESWRFLRHSANVQEHMQLSCGSADRRSGG